MNAVIADRKTQEAPWSVEPAVITREEFDLLMLWADEVDASDVSLMSDETINARIHGQYQQVTTRRLTSPEILSLLNELYGANASSLLAGGNALDFAIEIHRSREESVRLRLNATSGQTAWSSAGVEISARLIPEVPPTIEELNLRTDLVEAHRQLARTAGLCFVVGATGTGKSTLLAAMERDVLEKMPLKIVTYEAPVEFNLGLIPGRKGVVIQTEIPTHQPDFATGVANALRRAPNVIVVGEARDKETIAGAVQAGLTGHAVYTTLHANSVAAALPRAIGEFPASERRAMLVRILDVIRLIVTQRLVPKVGGGRIALREYLVFDQGMRLSLIGADLDRLQPVIHRLVKERGRSMLEDARAAHAAGHISDETLTLLRAEWEGEA